MIFSVLTFDHVRGKKKKEISRYEQLAQSILLRLKKSSDDEIYRRIARMLVLSQLEGFGKRQVNQLSGGQVQREVKVLLRPEAFII